MKSLHQGLVAAALLLATGQVALANGRPPATNDVKARSGGTEIVADTTFGTVISKDDGATWHWVCEGAVGYGGTFEPDWEWSPNANKLVVTTPEGPRLSSMDNCTYGFLPGLKLPASEEHRFTVILTYGPNGALYAATSDDDNGVNGSKIYRSTDDGQTFPQASTATPEFKRYDSWRSVDVAPSDPTRVYIAGIRVQANQPRVFLLYRSNDSAATFTQMSTNGITGLNPNGMQFIYVVGVSRTDANVLYLLVTQDGGGVGDAVYRSADGGTNWTKVLAKNDSLRAFVIRRNGEIYAGTPSLGSFKSTDGINFTPVAGAPHLSCLTERADGTLFGCTQNYGSAGDDAGIMKSTDGVTWTKLLRYQDIKAPLSCAAGTVQKDECEFEEWCGIREQLSISSNAISCPAIVPDGMPDSGQPMMPDSGGGGCCETNQAPPSLMLVGLTVFLLAWRKRRPRA